MDMWQPTTIPIKKTIHAPMLMRTWRSTQEDAVAHTFVNQQDISSSSFQAPTPSKIPLYEMAAYGDYILYQSNEGCGTVNRDKKKRGTLAVYQIGNEEQDTTAKLLGTVESNGHFGTMSLATLHPDRSLLAFHFVSSSGKSRILLWQFLTQGGVEPEHLHLDSALFRLSMAGSNGSLTSVPVSFWKLSNLQFDASGGQLIYQPENEFYPRILDISSFPVYQNSKTWKCGQMLGNQPTQSSLTKAKVSGFKVSASVNAYNAEVLKLGKSTLHADGSSTRLSLNPKAAHRELKIQYSNRGSSFEQQLLSLPAWKDVENISASVYPSPKAYDDRIMIVLNKTAKTLYKLDPKVKPTPPAIVWKNKRAIAKPIVGKFLPDCGPQTKRPGVRVPRYQPPKDEGEPSTKRFCYGSE
ncbi:hypothetical protein GQ44DRAFT_822848 [Phaeosphaeriaceae sp. PMI808]|nr:hypothetical protein GQ44DRAFT_822848 [Phaeosphaeriaceae sp. PMI808]